MEELKDIRGLTEVSGWPPAIGWWIVLAIALVAALLVFRFWFKYRAYRKSWQYKSFVNLRHIETQLSKQDDAQLDFKQILHKLAVEIRRIAMSTAKREACAGLVGKQWLEWLQKNDPRNYDWPTQGQLLIQYQYMPETQNYEVKQLISLITAAKQWVHKC
jgi:hypothetical protein